MGLFSRLFNKTEKTVREEQPIVAPIPQTHSHNSAFTQIRIPCDKCNGFYKIRDGKHGMFAGCSSYPNCKSTINLPELVLKYIEIYGLNIYRWEKVCYKCGKSTPVYSYYLSYDLEDLDEMFSMGGPTVGLGDLSYIDDLLSKEIPSIQVRYSKTTNSKYMANACEHCGALQGRNYVVDDPHEIIGELWHNHDMEKFLFKKFELADLTPLKTDIKRLYSQDEF
ncbi:topoisomerase DNA-binding C4 zinc finger domain-containing protein [Peptostreptococcus faecalis]|uniref:topoisomerase DNA-binding C4 zinc finger domain-containing protein n=1 Tax=Peptostreptococcus faecalis TaxID=2045015 RepID=UPI000C7D4146|nr:topoisomerase DNA-binding C4 zinc finger domain-containing protein [Peptostreptococcus faecalis]